MLLVEEINVEMEKFEKLISQDDIEEALIIFNKIACLLSGTEINESTTVEDLNFYREIILQLERKESALIERKNEIKMLLAPLNKYSQLKDGDVYSGRRK